MDVLLTALGSHLNTVYSVSGRVVAVYLSVFICLCVIILWQHLIVRREKAIFLFDSKLRQSVENDLFIINETIIRKNRIIEEMKRQRVLYSVFFKNSSDAFMVIENDKFIDCNDTTIKAFGCASRAEFLFKSPIDFSPVFQPGGEKSFELAEKYLGYSLEKNSFCFEWQHCQKDGTPFSANVVLTALDIDGKTSQLAIIRNISFEKEV